jgi:hypothetical protein
VVSAGAPAIRALLRGRLLVAALLLALATAACDGNAGGGNNSNQPTLVGTWRGSTTYDCLGQLTDEMIFKDDGTFSRLTSSTQVNCIPSTVMVRTTGDYEVDENLHVIRLSNIDTEPKEQCLPGDGCVPVHSVTTDTITYTMPDSNSLTMSCGSGCSIEYTKAGG